MDFFQFLRDLRDGMAAVDAGDALAELMEAVKATDKPGELNIKIVVTPAAKGVDFAYVFKETITTKAPKGEKAATVMFLHAGRLSRRDPRQPELPSMRQVDRESGELLEASNG